MMTYKLLQSEVRKALAYLKCYFNISGGATLSWPTESATSRTKYTAVICLYCAASGKTVELCINEEEINFREASGNLEKSLKRGGVRNGRIPNGFHRDVGRCLGYMWER